MKKRDKRRKSVQFICFALLAGTAVLLLYHYNLIPKKVYSAKDFGIKTLQSTVDFNGNGADDYTDILLGARSDAENNPKYDDRYYGNGGYPPDDIGVCTDTVWRAFKGAGYCLRDMVDNDIKERPAAYTKITVRDRNIDFRRVSNLRVYFEKYAVKLSLDPKDIEEWQPGDIVIFGNDRHIGIVSDKRNKNGIAYIIHNGGQPNREEDYLKNAQVTGHYRFDASSQSVSAPVQWYEQG